MLTNRIQRLQLLVQQAKESGSLDSAQIANLLLEVGDLLLALDQELNKNTEADRLLIGRIERQAQARDIDARQKIWVLLGIVGAIAALLLKIDMTTEWGQQTTENALSVLLNLLPVVLATLGIGMAFNQKKE